MGGVTAAPERYTMRNDYELEKAEHQFTGFDLALKGGTAVSLVQEMALHKDEWEQLKKNMPWLSKDLIEDVDEYFKCTR